MYRNMAQGDSGREVQDEAGDSILRSFLNAAKRDPTMFKQLGAVGLLARLDSMIAADLRVWWKFEFGLTISVLEMLAMEILRALGEKPAKELAEKYE
ncbi:hypothetical protein NPX13_g4163 [Xylaria arbuscula]|uniref:Uncharacterized protein n=1 Tax=Xylaria arbuscula TaxID=114810 RepID=A0A9W8NGD1_9PEZI|nr:hypothetical protein NPX13_g4163 [Xylaria arbuscula]